MTEAKFKHFCDKFVEAVFEFVATEEKKIEAEEIDKMSTPTNEVFVAICMYYCVFGCIATGEIMECLSYNGAICFTVKIA